MYPCRPASKTFRSQIFEDISTFVQETLRKKVHDMPQDPFPGCLLINMQLQKLVSILLPFS